MSNATTKSFNVVKINTDFTMASTKTNITSGENLMVSLGKIAKWYDETNGFTSSSESSTNKNLIPTYIQTPLTKNGITFTLEDDYSITANGTAASTTRVITGECTLPAGQYESWAWVTTDGTNIVGSDSTFLVELTYYDETNAQWVLFNFSNPSYIGRGNGYLVTLEESTRIRMTIIIYQGYVASNLNFKIVTATYNGDLLPYNYEPHIPSNEDLAKHITTLGSAAYIDSDNLVLGNVSHVSGSGNVISNIDFQQNLLGPGKVIEITKDNAIMRSDIPTSPTTGTNGWYNCRYSDSKIQYHVPDLSSYALTSHTHSYIPLTGSSAITGNLSPSVNSANLGTSDHPWYDNYFKYVNTASLYGVGGTINETITSHATIVPTTTNSASLSLGDDAHPWKSVWSKSFGFRNDLTSTTKSGTLVGATLTADRTWTLPDKTGTIALTSDIPAITATTSSSGSGNAVTAVSLSNGTLTVTKGSTFALSTHTHSYIPLSGSSSITGNLTPSTTNSISLGTSSKYWNNLYVNNINGSPLYEEITLSLVSGAKFSIKYKAYKIFGKFIYIDMDATATENITGATMGTSYGIAKVANGTTTNKVWNDASSVGVAYHNGSDLAYEIKAWVNTAGEVRVNVNSTALSKNSVIKFKIMYPVA